MPTKRRQSKHTEHRITPEAIAAFKAGDCRKLHRALALRPWMPSPFDAESAEPPAYLREADLWRVHWGLAHDLRCELEAA